MTPAPLLVVFVVPLLLLSSCAYLAKQGYHALGNTLGAREIGKVMADPDLPDSMRVFLEEVRRIKRFGTDSLGLADNRNYSTYREIDKGYLVDVVAAAKSDTFAQYTWWFPVVGRIPYKGFFEREDAKREASRLRGKGYDVTVGAVDAYSSLGFLRDPVYSFMSSFSRYRLSSLLLHEQTHATIYLKNRTSFNEQLATFIGNEGALQYIRGTCGDSSAAYREALAEKHDYSVWQEKLGQLYERLEEIYKRDADSGEKLKLKKAVIDSFKQDISGRYDVLFETELFRGLSDAPINNAFIMIRMNYCRDLSLFYALYRRNGCGLAATVRQLKTLEKKRGRPMELLREMVEER